MIKYTLDKYNGKKDKVYVMGSLSGGMMTNVLAGSYPDVFEAGAAYSGTARKLSPRPPACQRGSKWLMRLSHRCVLCRQPDSHAHGRQPDVCVGSTAHPGAVGQVCAQLVPRVYRETLAHADLPRSGQLLSQAPVRL